jgi:hypothetical protein
MKNKRKMIGLDEKSYLVIKNYCDSLGLKISKWSQKVLLSEVDKCIKKNV